MLGDLGKLIVAKGFKKLPKVQKIARSGHTDYGSSSLVRLHVLCIVKMQCWLKLKISRPLRASFERIYFIGRRMC